jgi:hypothetical protein
MSDKIKQVADAIKAALQEHPSVRLVENGPGGEEALKLLFEYVGRRAIEAIRDPTDAMIAAGQSVSTYDGVDEMESYGPPDDVFKAMIDAALDSGK